MRPGNQLQTVFLVLCLLCAALHAKDPDPVPGAPVPLGDYMNVILAPDTSSGGQPGTGKERLAGGSTPLSWSAPSAARQMEEDDVLIKLGSGAVFVPRMGENGTEPEIEILDTDGSLAEHGRSGRHFVLVPGTYRALIGSGTRDQKCVRSFTVTENRTKLLDPDWCGLSITTVDENNLEFRGEYEIARIDSFVSYGKGYGADPDLGEKSETWIFEPGIYKIFTIGQSYNTKKNFITVRLLAGEYAKLVLVYNDRDDMTIIGGGFAGRETGERLPKGWKYGLDIGGSLDFNSRYDKVKDSTDAITVLGILLNTSLTYRKNKTELNFLFQLDEGVVLPGFKRSGLSSTTDDVRFISLYTVNLFSWLGPYTRLEAGTEIVPEYARAPESVEDHYFVLLNQDSTIAEIDSLSASRMLQPALSPMALEVGAGVNISMFDSRNLRSKLLAGMALKQESHRDEAEVTDLTAVKPDTAGNYPAYDSIAAGKNVTVIRTFDDVTTSPELGPEANIDLDVNLGKVVTMESRLKTFFPLKRMEVPDVIWLAALRWNIARAVSLDYQYKITIQRPEEESAQKDEYKHRVLLRFSIN